MYSAILLKDKNIDYNLLTQLRFLFTNNVSQEYLDDFKNRKMYGAFVKVWTGR